MEICKELENEDAIAQMNASANYAQAGDACSHASPRFGV
jgi:hypothetical protein